MEMTITTPSLLFPAISLLMLAYTNRFITLAGIIRQLSKTENAVSEEIVMRQIANLRKRIKVIQYMQASGVMSFVFCTLSMFSLLLSYYFLGQCLFAISLILLVVSLLFSFYEVNISTLAINIELEKFDKKLADYD
jgi:Protein of unknown function (DUF2721)